MLLDDPRLNFASDLIAHWTAVRGSCLVPFDIQIDPTKMVRAVPFVMIARIQRPETVEVVLAESGSQWRHGRDVTGLNLFNLFSLQSRRALEQVRRWVLSIPCGVYLRFQCIKWRYSNK